jgi:hypothetical protein
VCGPRTVGAIQNFQVRQLGFKMADGRVDPGGPTLKKLNEFSASGIDQVISTRTVLKCPHGGHVDAAPLTPRPPGPNGQVTLQPTDRFDVIGCPMPEYPRCVRVKWVLSSTPLTRRSIGLCVDAAGFPTGPVQYS